jgi:putative addiction module CopG family antidote
MPYQSTVLSSLKLDHKIMIELTPQQQQFVDAQVASGIFKEPAEVVGEALTLLQQRQREYDQLKTAIQQVECREYEPLDIEDVKRRGRERKAPQ